MKQGHYDVLYLSNIHSAFTMMAAEEEYFIFTGGVVPPDVTRVRIDESISVIPARAFYKHPNITELYCHIRVKKVEKNAFRQCRSLRQVIMPGVEVVELAAFCGCAALTDVECGKLEIIGKSAFGGCNLRSVNFPSAKIVEADSFWWCKALTTISFGKELESIRDRAFLDCTSLERITITLKDDMISRDNIFTGCKNLKHVDLVEGAILHKAIAAFQMKEWRNNMYREIDAISQILPTTSGGTSFLNDMGGKAEAIRTWITNVLRNIIHYKTEHHHYLKEATITLELALWKKRLREINVPEGDEEGRAKCRVKCGADIVMKNVLPFLELPLCTFKMKD
eukprot:scaffold586_cov112-Skeletonema_dohrnii-CCMP3373.AAC.4